MKKILIFISLYLFPIFIYAEETTVFSLSELTASPGNNVTVNLNIENKQEFGVLTAKIYYDNTKLTYVSSELKGLDNSALNGVEKNQDKGLIAVYAINLSKNKLMKDNGNILTIEFKIDENANEDIALTLEIKDFGLVDSTSFNYITKNGIIHIKNDVETVTKNKKTSVIDNLKEELAKNGLTEKDIIISSSNDDIATVDESGNIEFKNDGNVDIVAKDSEGNIVYTKEYFVKSNINKNNRLLFSIIISSVVFLIIISLIIIRKKKCLKEKQK